MILNLLRKTALIALGALLLAGPFLLARQVARADDSDQPVDAVPLVRPGALPPRSDTAPDMPAPAAPDEAPAPLTSAGDEPKFGAVPLPPPEAAIERIAFDPDEVTLGAAAQARLQTFADRFKTQSGRIALRAYAGEIADVGMNARRTALKRALSVREFLLAQGIDAERIDVQALGGVRDAGPHDRVDIIQSGRQTVRKKTPAAD
jgi:outer membrane protein OmpA-like peptidoglycan-associated protein